MKISSAATVALFWLAALTCVCAQDSAAASCATVLTQGVYNTIQTSSNIASWSEFQQSACFDNSGYSYSAYLEDSKNNQQSSNYGKATVGIKVFGYGSGNGGSNSGSTALSEEQYKQYQKTSSAYRSSACDTSTGNNSNNQLVTELSKWVDPSIVNAYTSCLAQFAAGIRFSVTTGVASRNFNVDITYDQGERGGQGTIDAIAMSPEGSAACVLSGPGVYMKFNSTTNVSHALDNKASYHVVCEPSSLTLEGLDSQIGTDIFIGTTPGKSFHAILYRAVTASPFGDLQAQVKALQAQVAAQAALQDEVQARVAAQAAQFSGLQVDANGFIANLKVYSIVTQSIQVTNWRFVQDDGSNPNYPLSLWHDNPDSAQHYRYAFFPGKSVDL